MRKLLLLLAAVLPLSAQWANPVGFNFRASYPYVTDPTNTADDDGKGYGSSYSVGAETVTAGWEASVTLGGQSCGGAPIAVDRDPGVDARLAGIVYAGPGECKSFRVAAPGAGSTSFKFTVALGDAANPQSGQYLEIYDGTTLRATVATNGSTVAAEFYEADGTKDSAASWSSNNASHAVTATVNSGIIRFKLGNTSGSGYSALSHVSIEQVAAAPASVAVKRRVIQ